MNYIHGFIYFGRSLWKDGVLYSVQIVASLINYMNLTGVKENFLLTDGQFNASCGTCHTPLNGSSSIRSL